MSITYEKFIRENIITLCLSRGLSIADATNIADFCLSEYTRKPTPASKIFELAEKEIRIVKGKKKVIKNTEPLYCPTTQKWMESYLLEKQKEAPRYYLGMSEIGDKCQRNLWLNFRFSSDKIFDANSYLRFEDGHHSEKITAERLLSNNSINLLTTDKNGKQFEYKLLDGHFVGHVDGLISGIEQDPAAFYVWENKCVDGTSFRKLIKLLQNNTGNKSLEIWNIRYFVQAMLYMFSSKINKCFYTVCTSGSRNYLEFILTYDKEVKEAYLSVAEDIIFKNKIPDKIYQNHLKPPCSWCQNKAICFEEKLPKVTCRSCVFSAPSEGGKWVCKKFQNEINKETQLTGCNAHLFNPQMIPWATQIDSDDTSIVYEKKSDFKRFKNTLEGGSNSGKLDAIICKSF